MTLSPVMTFGLRGANPVRIGDLCCNGLGQGEVPVAQGHQDADSLSKLWIWQVSELLIVC